jgi:hypothetical protein
LCQIFNWLQSSRNANPDHCFRPAHYCSAIGGLLKSEALLKPLLDLADWISGDLGGRNQA